MCKSFNSNTSELKKNISHIPRIHQTNKSNYYYFIAMLKQCKGLVVQTRALDTCFPKSKRFSCVGKIDPKHLTKLISDVSSLEHQRLDQSPPKSKNKSKDWTWKQQTDVIKWQGTPLDGPLLRLDDAELTPLAIECFDCILRYCGDQPLTPEMSEVKCVYTVLMVMFLLFHLLQFFLTLYLFTLLKLTSLLLLFTFALFIIRHMQGNTKVRRLI